MRLLLRRGADVNRRGWGLRQALHWAADRGQLACVKALLAAGADAAVEDALGDDALELARRRRHTATVAVIEAAAAPALSADGSWLLKRCAPLP